MVYRVYRGQTLLSYHHAHPDNDECVTCRLGRLLEALDDSSTDHEVGGCVCVYVRVCVYVCECDCVNMRVCSFLYICFSVC